jgi:hypothetical protein
VTTNRVVFGDVESISNSPRALPSLVLGESSSFIVVDAHTPVQSPRNLDVLGKRRAVRSAMF